MWAGDDGNVDGNVDAMRCHLYLALIPMLSIRPTDPERPLCIRYACD